jgi:hypothetical protein
MLSGCGGHPTFCQVSTEIVSATLLPLGLAPAGRASCAAERATEQIKAQAGHSRLSALALSDRPAEKGSRLLWLTSNNGRDSSLDPIDTRVATTSNYKRALSLKRGSGDGGLESPRLCYRD